MDLRLVLQGERGNVGVGDQIGSHAGGGEVPRQPGEVIAAGIDRRHVWGAEPCLYVVGRLIR